LTICRPVTTNGVDVPEEERSTAGERGDVRADEERRVRPEQQPGRADRPADQQRLAEIEDYTEGGRPTPPRFPHERGGHCEDSIR